MSDFIETYLRQMVKLREGMGAPPEGFFYRSMEDFVLQEGQPYESAKLTPAEEKAVLRAIVRSCESFPIKMCYSNSLLLTLAGPKLSYVEGYFTSERIGLPLQHGWVTINGKVVDMTARLSEPRKAGAWPDRVFGEFPSGRTYFGVEFDRKYISSAVEDPKFTGSIIDDYERDYPVLKSKHRAVVR